MKKKDFIVAVLRERCLRRGGCKHCLFYRLGNRVGECTFEVQPWEWETKEEQEAMEKADAKVMELIRNGKTEKLLEFMKALEEE